MNKLLCLAALAGLIAAVPAAAVMDMEAPTPAQILAEANKKAYALPSAEHQPVQEARATGVETPLRPLGGRWQAIAKVKSMTHRGSIPQWTHQCYATAKQASDAAVAACERYNHTECYGEPYIADRCDR